MPTAYRSVNVAREAEFDAEHPSALSGHRILVVDDDPSIRTAIKGHLLAAGCHVTTAEDGLEAITLFDDQGADLIILDVMMPGVDGFDVCQTIKQYNDVPIIFLTGADDPMIKNYLSQIVQAADGDHYLRKPCDMQELLRLIRRALSE